MMRVPTGKRNQSDACARHGKTPRLDGEGDAPPPPAPQDAASDGDASEHDGITCKCPGCSAGHAEQRCEAFVSTRSLGDDADSIAVQGQYCLECRANILEDAQGGGEEFTHAIGKARRALARRRAKGAAATSASTSTPPPPATAPDGSAMRTES